MSSAKWRPFILGLNVLTDICDTLPMMDLKSCSATYCRMPCAYAHFPINSLRPRQNGRNIADDIFKRIFLNENVRIFIWILLKFVPKGPINNIPASIRIMAWRRPGDKPLFEPMMVRLTMHICVTRPQWVNEEFRSVVQPNASLSSCKPKNYSIYLFIYALIYLKLYN